MQVASLGETAAAGLLVFTVLGEKHTSGFHIDSGGNPAIRELSLIGPPQTLAALQIPITKYELESPAQALLTPSSLASIGATLFDQYQEALGAILDQPTKEGELQTKRHDRGYHLLQERNRRCLESWLRPFLGQPVNLKTHYVELINHLLNSLVLYHGIIPDHSAEMIDQLADRGSFAEETTLLLKECLEMIYQMRVRLHLHHRQQQDHVEIHPTHPNAFPLTNSVNPKRSFVQRTLLSLNTLKSCFFPLLKDVQITLALFTFTGKTFGQPRGVRCSGFRCGNSSSNS